MNEERLIEIEAHYQRATTMAAYLAGKRIHVTHVDDPEWDWWIGWGKEDSCQIEGQANHWRWLALLILGLADQKDVPYSESKPTPEIVPDLCQALREAWEEITQYRKVLADNELFLATLVEPRDPCWAEIKRVKELTVRLGSAVDEVLLSNAGGIVLREDVQELNSVALTTEEWRSLGEDRR